MTKQLPDLEFFTLSETARKLGVSVDTLRRWEKKGKINGIRTEGGHRRFSLEEIENFRYKKIREKIRPITYDSLTPSPVISSVIPPVIAPQVQLVSKYNEVYQKPSFNIFRYVKFIFILFLFLVLFFFAKLGVPQKLTSYLPDNIKATVASTVTNTKSFIEKRFSFLKPSETPEASNVQDNQSSAVLAESTSKDISFNVNITSDFKENGTFEKDLTVKGALITGAVNPASITTTGNITAQNITSRGAVVGITGTFTGNLTVGNITSINGVTYSFPSTQGGSSTFLKNDGSGTLTWSSLPSISLTSGVTGVLPIANGGTNNSSSYTSGSVIFSDGSKLTQSNSNLFWDNTNSRLGLLTTTPTSTLSVGASNQFQVNSTGNLVKLNNVTYSWPTANAAGSNYVLSSDAAGTLTWSAFSSLGGVNGSGANNQVTFWTGTGTISGNNNFTWNNTTSTFTVTGTTSLSGATTVGGATTDLITFTGRVASGTSLIPAVNLGSDLGTTALRWNNLYVGTVNSNSTISSTGQALFTYSPTDTTYGQSSVEINPTTAPTDSYLLGIGIAGSQRAGIDAEGDIRLGYNGGAGASTPTSANPLMVYNHSTTNVFSVDTSGNLSIGGTAITLTGSSPIINLTSATTLSLNTTTNRPITTGTGLFTAGGALTVNGIITTNTAGSRKLVLNDVTDTNEGIYFNTSADQNYFIGRDATAWGVGQPIFASSFFGWTFQTNGTTRMVIDSSGNTGIGTSTPTSKLHLTGAVTGKALAIFNETGDQALFTASSSGTTKFVINNSGQVGIGLTPNSTLDVAIQFPNQKAITITNSGSALTNYAILVITDTSTLVSQGKLQSSCQDLRFTDSDNVTQLVYYIESGCNTTNSQIWVQVPSVPNGTKTIYMHYGNTNAPAATRTLPAQNFIAPFNTTCPAGWSSVTGINNSTRFVRGNTAAGATGGSVSTTHTVSGTTGGPSGTANQDTGGSASNAATSTHTHTLGTTTTSAPSNGQPPFVDTVYCSFNGSVIPNTVPTSFIGMFDTIPSGWTRDATYDTNFLRGNTTAGGTGGSATHTHTFTGTTGGPSASVTNNTGVDVRPDNAHTHTFTSVTTAAASSLPSFRDMLIAKPNATASLAAGLVIAFDAANTPPLGWAQYTNLNGKFPRGNTTSGGTGGADTHSHTFSVTSGVESSSAAAGAGAGGTVNGKSHTHTLTGTSSTDSSLPPYIEEVYYQRNTDSTTNTVGSETSTVGPERDLVVGSNGYTGVGQTSPLWRLQVSDYREASASALIENTANLSLFNPTGLIIRMGNDATNPDTGDRFINFMKGDSTVVGKIQGNGGTGSVNYATAGTDFAEYFKKDDPQELLEAGDAVCIGLGGITKCLPQNSNKVVGVISNQAGFTGGMQHEDDPGYAIVGLSGQLSLKIASSSADIKTGDLLTSSSEPGKASKAIVKGGYYIAKALEDWSFRSGKDRIRVLIQSGYYDSPFLTFDGSGNISSNPNSANNQPTVLGALTTATDSESLNMPTLSIDLSNLIASMSAQIKNVESDITLLKSQSLIATGSGTATDSATLVSLSVLKNAILSDTVINGKLNIGTLTIDNTTNSIDAVGTLKIQSLALGNVDFMNGKVTIDPTGNVVVNTIAAKKYTVLGTSAGSSKILAGQTSADVLTDQINDGSIVMVTPTSPLSTPIVVVQKTKKIGFTVHISSPQIIDTSFDWWIVDKQ